MKRILYSFLILFIGSALIVGCGTGPTPDNTPTPSSASTVTPTASPTVKVDSYQVILSHDGYPDPDDNGAMLGGFLVATDNAKKDSRITIVGLIYGDTTKTKQNGMINGSTDLPVPPAKITDDQRGRANYTFFLKYGRSAITSLNPVNFVIEDITPQTYNFEATELDKMTTGGKLIAKEILKALEEKLEVIRVIVSAGGGVNSAAEAIAYVRKQKYRDEDIKAHFAIVQHSQWNWQNATETTAQEIAATFTIRIEDQNKYTGKDLAPSLSLPPVNKEVSETKTSSLFVTAWQGAVDDIVSTNPIVSLPHDNDGWIPNFRGKSDVSDAGSHHFATNSAALDANWNVRNNNLNAPANKLEDTTIGTLGNPLKYGVFTTKELATLLK